MLNKSLSEFKRQHQKKINQVLFVSRKINDDTEILNLIENFLVEKNSFIFESVEKGKIKGRYTIFGKNPDKIWEFNNDKSNLIEDKSKKRIKGSPDKIIEKIIEKNALPYPHCNGVSSKTQIFFSHRVYNS